MNIVSHNWINKNDKNMNLNITNIFNNTEGMFEFINIYTFVSYTSQVDVKLKKR